MHAHCFFLFFYSACCPSACVRMCACVLMYILYICICMYLCVCTCLCVYLTVCIFVCLCNIVHVCLCVCSRGEAVQQSQSQGEECVMEGEGTVEGGEKEGEGEQENGVEEKEEPDRSESYDRIHLACIKYLTNSYNNYNGLQSIVQSWSKVYIQSQH